MATTILISKSNEEITTLMNKKFIPKLKTENDSTYFFSGKNIVTQKVSEENKYFALNKMSFLFPSIPIKKIETIFKENKNISIEEGIEKLKELTLSENTKNKSNKIEHNSANNNVNRKNFIYTRKFQKNFPNKRNYNCLLSQSNQIQGNQNYNDMINNNNIINNEFVLNQQKIEKERELQNQKEIERLNERKKMELKTVDKVAQELLESKDLNELKEYLFTQLKLLDQKKREDNKNQQIKYEFDNAINQLNNDKFELRKCNTVVTQAVNKKIVEAYKLENRVRKLEGEINQIRESINYHERMGDLYKEKLKEIGGGCY